jgi:DNA mismatch endonuclease, patch repair protein
MDPEVRRRVMASIRKVNTRPELALRRALWRSGVRGWRCHVRSGPGTPDLVFRRWRVAVHVDGVWWHGHPDYLPAGRRGPYWDQKIARNRERDRLVDEVLRKDGWTTLRLWDLDVLRDPTTAVGQVVAALQERGWAA